MINNDIKINTERDSKFEILRIVAIVMIIYHHFIVHAPGVNPMELYNSGDITFFNLIITELMASFGKVGVFIFGLLTGYFMIDKNCIRFSRVIKLILLTLFYSIIIYSLSIYFDFVEFSIKNLLHICLPLTFNLYWFITAYVLLCIFIPYLNKLLINCSQKQILFLITVLFLLWYVVPTIFCVQKYYSTKFYVNDFLSLVYAYICGAYIKRFITVKINIYKITFGIIVILSSIVMVYYLLAKYQKYLIESDLFINSSLQQFTT